MFLAQSPLRQIDKFKRFHIRKNCDSRRNTCNFFCHLPWRMVIPLKNNKNHFDRGPFYILKPAELLPGRYSSANYCWLGGNLFDEYRGPLDSWWLMYIGCWWLKSNFAYSRFNRRSSWKPRPISSPSETHAYHRSPFLASPSAATPSLSPSLASPAPASPTAASPVPATPSLYSLSPTPASPATLHVDNPTERGGTST